MIGTVRTQDQIMESWKKGDACAVSVVCITYNHEQYIREAIESFLMQETSFPFEVIIHDDASTDNTAKIINEYHSNYPDIIKPILQKENQHSKGGFKPSCYAAGHSIGKYVALCEGDDYWICKDKLMIQVDAMENNNNVDFSFHSAFRLREGKREQKPFWDYGNGQVFSIDKILDTFRSFAPTPSYMFRREVFLMLPKWFFNIAPVGDFFLEMYGSKRGGALYINKPMSMYRLNTPNAWGATMKAENYSHYQHMDRMLTSLQLLKPDFQKYIPNFRKKESICLYYIALYHLFSGHKNEFIEAIDDSVEKYRFFSITQKLLYRFKFITGLGSMIKIARKLRKKQLYLFRI